jgi:O-antigen ligase
MPPLVALALCVLFILYLFWKDYKQDRPVSNAIWVPLLYMMIIGSRFISQWLNVAPTMESTEDYLEGSPVDRLVFVGLIAASLFILLRRKINWSQILRTNIWILLFFLYCGISIIWSDFPFVAFKRWIKGIGNVLMVLVILTEAHPVEALKTIIRRCAYVLVPLSVLLIKYFSDIGRGYDRWTGKAVYMGVGYNKNSLGYLCLVCGFFFLWSLFTPPGNRRRQFFNYERLLQLIFLGMIFWLLGKSASATSFGCLFVGICVAAATGVRFVKKNLNSITLYALAIVFLLTISGLYLDLARIAVDGLGRDMTLTDRVPLWEELLGMSKDSIFIFPYDKGNTGLWEKLLEMSKNSLFGAGFESFWLGPRVEELWKKYWWRPTQAHNGYLEIYLNLGIVGLLLLLGVVQATYRSARRTLDLDFNYGRFRMGFLITILLYNVTEAAFQGQALIWFVFLLIAIEVPLRSELGLSISADKGPVMEG